MVQEEKSQSGRPGSHLFPGPAVMLVAHSHREDRL